MALIEYRLDGKIDKVETAIKRIQLANLSEEPLNVCYSGGKDSKVIRHLMGMSGVPHELHYNLTTVDIPSVVREILDDKEVIVDKARYADGTQKTGSPKGEGTVFGRTAAQTAGDRSRKA